MSEAKTFPPQHQPTQPGHETPMTPMPESDAMRYQGSAKLAGKVALITGGDSGIGRSTAICYAKEGADLILVYLHEHEDAQRTQMRVMEQGAKCLLLPGDLRHAQFIHDIVSAVTQHFGKLDILVNNAAEQHPKEDIREISSEQLEQTFRTNFFAMFNLTREALPLMAPGSCIINTTSVTAYRGSKHLLDYAASKGAIVSFTRSLALQLADRHIRVNAVAPGPVWTPLIPSTFDAQHVAQFGTQVPLKRAAQPDEISPSYVFLACEDARYMTGQVLHPNGGEIINA